MLTVTEVDSNFSYSTDESFEGQRSNLGKVIQLLLNPGLEPKVTVIL